MRHPLPIFLLSAAFAATLPAQSPNFQSSPQPGFDCSKAATAQEKTICASPELSKADAEMTAAYKAWLAAAPAVWQPEIRQNQRLWLRLRPEGCMDKNDKERANCLLSTEQDRAKTLQSMVQYKNTIQFVWRALTFTAPDSSDEAAERRKYHERDFGYVNITWPQAKSNTPEWIAWNKAITSAAKHTSGNPAKLWAPKDAIDTDADTTIALNLVSDNLVSATLESYEYNHGAAHGGSGTIQFNWLLKEQRKLKPADVFRPQIYWSNELYKRTDQYLHSKLDGDSGGNYQTFSSPADMQKTVRALVADPTRWQIDRNGITIPFQQYEVACYACTPEPFTMSWESLKPLLNPAFSIPR